MSDTFTWLGCAGSPLIFVPRGRTLLRNAFNILLQFLSSQFSFFLLIYSLFVHSLPRTFTFFLWIVTHLISYSLFSIDFCFRFYNGYHVLERYEWDSSNYSIEIELMNVLIEGLNIFYSIFKSGHFLGNVLIMFLIKYLEILI